MKAVKRFDPERGVRLVSFAIHWIKAEIHEYILRNWRMVKVATTKAQRKLFFNLRSMKTGLAPLTRDDIKRVAAELRVKPEEVVEMEKRLSGQEIAFEATTTTRTATPRRNTSPTTKPSRSACWRPKNRRAYRPPACRRRSPVSTRAAIALRSIVRLTIPHSERAALPGMTG